MPTAHPPQLLDDTPEYRPPAQDKQREEETCPVLDWYVPAGQLEHADAPATAWYFPKVQLRQFVELVPTEYLPTSHAVQLSAPAAE